VSPIDLRGLSDEQLRALEEEMDERREQFDARVRQQINDELRRRRLAPKAKRR
jgi:hypothetical protein